MTVILGLIQRFRGYAMSGNKFTSKGMIIIDRIKIHGQLYASRIDSHKSMPTIMYCDNRTMCFYLCDFCVLDIM